MNDQKSSNEKFRERLEQFREYMTEADSDKIGAFAVPEIQTCDHEGMTLTLRYKYYPWMNNCNNVMHGGMVSLILDNSMGWLACTWPEQPQVTPTPTISMQVTFLEPVFLCDYITVSVKVTAAKSHIMYMTATFYDEAHPEKILATATGEYYRIKHPIRQ